jgi:hypothetical protein
MQANLRERRIRMPKPIEHYKAVYCLQRGGLTPEVICSDCVYQTAKERDAIDQCDRDDVEAAFLPCDSIGKVLCPKRHNRRVRVDSICDKCFNLQKYGKKGIYCLYAETTKREEK